MTDSGRGASRVVRDGRLLGLAVALLLVLPCCTTYVRPVACGQQKFACGERHDVLFCVTVALAVQGADCAQVGLSVGKPFCYVSAGHCVQDIQYALQDRDCVVLRHELLGERDECPQGTSTFGP